MKLLGKLKNSEMNSAGKVWKYSIDARDENASETNYTTWQRIVIVIACLTFFPGMYVLGRLIINLFG